MLWKCSVCGLVHEGPEAPEKCPKCGAPKEKFVALSDDDAKKVYASDRTNDIHMEIIRLSMKIADLADEGVKLNLDPACVSTFRQAKNEVWIIKQRSKAELAGHMAKGKW
ncbi:MAG: rubredoxin [Tenericutes bacterium GWF2_57_13]|nr:MAG: rubredoxin [Tenericutes bacterium GWF2_57_13]